VVEVEAIERVATQSSPAIILSHMVCIHFILVQQSATVTEFLILVYNE